MLEVWKDDVQIVTQQLFGQVVGAASVCPFFKLSEATDTQFLMLPANPLSTDRISMDINCVSSNSGRAS